MDDPEGPTQTEAILVTGGLIGVALALLVQAQASGTAAAEQAFGIIAAMAVMLGLWWWARQR